MIQAAELGRREFLSAGLAVVLAPLAPGSFGVAVAQPKRPRVRFGVGVAVAYSPCYVALEKRLWEEEGVDVDYFPAPGGSPDVIPAVIGGSADGGVGGSFGLIAGVEKGAPVITVAVYAYGGERLALAVRIDSGIKTLPDLYGKKVGVQSGAIGQQMLNTMAEIEKLDMSKIDVVPLNNVDMPAAVGAKMVDAIITWEPYPSLLEAKGLVRVIQRGGKYLQSPGAVMFGTSFIEKSHAVVFRLVKAHFRACQFIRQHPREAAVIVQKHVKGTTPEVIEQSFRYLVFDPRVTKMIVGEFEADMRFMLSQKKIASPVPAKALITSTFSDEVEKRHPELVADLMRK
jgi:ABC-type nitrate/sulfonate/bicarbonate transport system substrate-binding protein